MLRNPRIIRNSPDYRISFYPRSPDALIIVFASAARVHVNENVEEFRRTLERFDASVCFVHDVNAGWYNHPEIETVWAELAQLARDYRQVDTVGESMGGCGALLAARHVPGVRRTLAFAPQFSMAKPFINFDYRYEPIGRHIPCFRYVHYADVPDPSSCTLLFGNMDWGDYLQSAMFTAHGFEPAFIDGAGHGVASFLKHRPDNGLLCLFDAFLDHSRPFGRETVDRLFPELATGRGIHPDHCFSVQAAESSGELMHRLEEDFAAETGEVLGRNLAWHRPARQSSTSVHSARPDPEEDAVGAVTGAVGHGMSFHTALEEDPWWQVDLGADYLLQEVRLFNVVAHPDVMARSAALDILVSRDANAWWVAHHRTNPATFGGADGHPLVWRPGERPVARFVRLQLRGTTYLHLNHVQVFGRPFCRAG